MIGGTVNGTGGLVMRAERVGSETMLAQIIRMVSEARRTRAPIQRLADVVSSYFVPAVVVVAVITFIAWAVFGPQPRLAHALVNAVAVLIIACPCALGLATPMSIMVGTGRGAAAGVLIKNAEALEVLERVDTLVIDKTGTLTEGKPRVVSVVPMPGKTKPNCCDWPPASSLRASIRWPRPSLRAARSGGSSRDGRVVPVPHREGREGKVDGRSVVDRQPSVARVAGDCRRSIWRTCRALRRDGQTVVFVAIDGHPAGLLGIADPIKESAAAAIDDLRKEGLRVIMLTGDNRTTAEAVARGWGSMRFAPKCFPIRRPRKSSVSRPRAASSPWPATASTTRPRSPSRGRHRDGHRHRRRDGERRRDARQGRPERDRPRPPAQPGDHGQYPPEPRLRVSLQRPGRADRGGGPLSVRSGILLSPMIASLAMTFSSVSVIVNALRLRQNRDLEMNSTSVSLLDRLKAAGPDASDWNRLQGIICR